MGVRRQDRLDQVYAAIADPTRRAIVAELSRGESNIATLVARFPVSFNAVSKHVKVLERAGLVERQVRGREHWLRLNAVPFSEASGWLEHYRGFWEERLEALEALVVESGRREPVPARSGSRPPR